MNNPPLHHLEPFGLKLDIAQPLRTEDIDKTIDTINKAHQRTGFSVIASLAFFVSSLISGILGSVYAMQLVFFSIFCVFIICVYTSISLNGYDEAHDLLKELHLHSHSAELHELSTWAEAYSPVKQYLKTIHNARRKPTIAEYQFLRLYVSELQWSDAFQDHKEPQPS